MSLMKDQVESLKARGVQAEFLSSNESKQENYEKKDRVLRGEVKILYVTPERLEFWSESYLFISSKTAVWDKNHVRFQCQIQRKFTIFSYLTKHEN